MIMKKKVVQTLYSGTGGHAVVVFNLLENGGLKNWDNYLFFYGVEELEKGHQEFCEKNHIAYSSAVKKSKLDFAGLWKHFRYFQKVKPDVLLVHNSVILLPALLYYFLYRPILVTVDHTPNLNKRKSENWACRTLLKFSQKYVVLNDQHVLELEKSHPLYRENKQKIVVIPNGITYPKYYAKKAIKGRIGMISRFSHQKDQKTLIEAFSILSKRNKDVELYLIGSGETLSECQALADKLNLKDKITFTGNISFDQAQELCATFQLFVMSTLAETVGMVVLEAFAKRTPVLATEVEGIVEYMEDGVNGFLVPAQNPELMAEKIEFLLQQDDTFFEPIISNALATIDKKFDAEKTFQKYEAAISG